MQASFDHGGGQADGGTLSGEREVLASAAGTQIGNQALDAVREVKSTRLLDHLKPLQSEARRHQHDSAVRDLHHEVRRLRSAA